MRFLCFLLITACASLPALAQIYKWVDEKGATQYGERPPSEKTAKKLNIPGANASSTGSRADSSDARPSLHDLDTDFRKRQILREEAEAKEEKAKAEKLKKQRACMQAKDDLRVLRDAAVTYHLNDKGERVYENEVERKAVTDKMEADYNENCKQQ
jgi:hypothetical protein